ncbi:MAG: membrane protein insertase YidC [Acidobacteriota bacterium]|nr:MAG: membrane protein insertase YidC [Acidobacteriota bacterium]
MSHEQRLLLALGLSMLIFVVWIKLFTPPEPVPPEPESVQEPSPDGALPSPEGGQEDAPPPEEPSPDQAEEAGERWKEFSEVYRAGVPEREQGVVLSTDKFHASFTTRGARLESFVLKEYLDAGGRPLELVYDGMNTKPMGYRLPLAVDIDGRPGRTEEANRALYLSEVEEQDKEIRATFLYASEDDFYVRKFFRFHKDAYPFEVEVEAAEGGVRLPVYVRLGPGFGTDEEAESSRFYNIREFVFGFSQGGAWRVERASRDDVLEAAKSSEAGMLSSFLLVFKSLPYAPVAEGSVRLVEAPRWAAMGDNYFSAVALSEQGFPEARLHTAVKEKKIPGEEEPLVEVEAAGLGVPADALTQLAFIPKDFRVLRPMEQKLSDLVDLGFLWWLSLPLLWLLNFFHGYVGNYGIAIILVTVVVKILFHPLTHKGMVSMRRMQKLQPKMSALREKYRKKKDAESRQKMNEEMMALYKKEGVNPLGGCLPLLLQMPVLFAFYSLLMVSIEIRQAPFYLWIKDLSQPDPYYVTPIVMGITMFLQQRMSQPPAAAGSELQMRLMKWMPVFFTWLFLSFPSGLVLYWLTNNVLSIVQQRWINKATDASAPPKPAKEKGRRKKDAEKKDAEKEDAENAEKKK